MNTFVITIFGYALALSDLIEIIILSILVAVTAYYARQTRLARRVKAALAVSVYDPTDYELSCAGIDSPNTKHLCVKGLLLNPSLVPIFLRDVEEKIWDVNGKELPKKDAFYLCPRNIQNVAGTQYALYVFAIPWVIAGDGFNIWSRCIELEDYKQDEYKVTIEFIYSVGEDQPNTVKKELNLRVREGHVVPPA